MNPRASVESLSPEWQFVLAAAAPPAQSSNRDDAEEIVAAVKDWTQVALLAEAHGVRPLCAELVRSGNSPAVPTDWFDSLSENVRILTRRSLALTAELIHLMDLLASSSISAITYKGPVLAAQAFDDIARREYGDLDILVHHENIGRIAEVMQGEGYRTALPDFAVNSYKSPIPGQYSFSRPGALPVEFHSEETLRYYPVPLDLAFLESHIVRVRIGDRLLPTFSPEAGLTILSVHGCKHLWSRVLWVADIAWLLHSTPSLDWESAMDCGRRLRSVRMMLTGVGLAASLLGARIPDAIEAQISADNSVQGLIEESRRELLASGGAAGVMQRAIFRIRSVEGFGKGLRYLSRLASSPAEDDWADGKRARFSAALARPRRLIAKYGFTRKRG